MKTKELYKEAISLPVEDRAILIDSLIKSLNPMEKEIEEKWLEVARERYEEIQSGNVKLLDGQKVLKKIGIDLK